MVIILRQLNSESFYTNLFFNKRDHESNVSISMLCCNIILYPNGNTVNTRMNTEKQHINKLAILTC